MRYFRAQTKSHIVERCMHTRLIQFVMAAIIQGFSSWLSKNRDENPRMRKIFNSKGRACADSRRDFWTTNWKTPVKLFFHPLPAPFSCTAYSSTASEPHHLSVIIWVGSKSRCNWNISWKLVRLFEHQGSLSEPGDHVAASWQAN